MDTPPPCEVTAGYYQASAACACSAWRSAPRRSVWPALRRARGRPPVRHAVAAQVAAPASAAWDAAGSSTRWPFEDAEPDRLFAAGAPHGPVALLVHGWGGHARQLLALADSLAQHGLRPVLLEMPAHGRSAGAGQQPAAVRPRHRLRRRPPAAGRPRDRRCWSAIRWAPMRPPMPPAAALPIGKLVLLAPPASPRDYTRYFAQVFGLSEATRVRHAEAASRRAKAC